MPELAPNASLPRVTLVLLRLTVSLPASAVFRVAVSEIALGTPPLQLAAFVHVEVPAAVGVHVPFVA